MKRKIASNRKPTHAWVGKIVDDIQLVGNDAMLPEDRFSYWHQRLDRECARQTHGALYEQLLAMALRFARHRCRAATQLFTLASLHPEAERVLVTDAFVRGGRSYG